MEIGVGTGDNYKNVNVALKVGIDPNADSVNSIKDSYSIIVTESDNFFSSLDKDFKFDLRIERVVHNGFYGVRIWRI